MARAWADSPLYCTPTALAVPWWKSPDPALSSPRFSTHSPINERIVRLDIWRSASRQICYNRKERALADGRACWTIQSRDPYECKSIVYFRRRGCTVEPISSLGFRCNMDCDRHLERRWLDGERSIRLADDES